MILYSDFDSLFERFSIMTVDGHLTDKEAVAKLKPLSAPGAFNELKTFISKNNDFLYADTF